MRVYISVDIEGATGIASFSQCSRPDRAHYDFPFARRMLTHDVNAAIRGARAAGATAILVKDSHGFCKNLLVDELEPGVELISGIGSGTLGMMEGIDGHFDAAMLVGYHATAGTRGMMEHALTGGLHRIWINGRLAVEIAVSAALAGAFGVPTVFVSSDDAGCKEAALWLDGVKTYETKAALGHAMGRMRPPSETGPGIEAAAQQAILDAKGIGPFIIAGPVSMKVEFRTSNEADLAETLSRTHREDAYSVSFESDDFLSAHQFALNVFQLAARGRTSGD